VLRAFFSESLVKQRFPCESSDDRVARCEELHSQKENNYCCDKRRRDKQSEIFVTAIASPGSAQSFRERRAPGFNALKASLSYRVYGEW
jgi:hypothetical protein